MSRLQQPCCYFSLRSLLLINRVFYSYTWNTRRFKSGNCRDGAKTLVHPEKTKELIEVQKVMDKKAANTFCFNIQQAGKLNLTRKLPRKGLKRVCDRIKSSLPKFRSPCFGRYYFFKEDDLRENTTLGSGPGGQATNRRKQTIILKHDPSRIIIRFGRFASLWCNRCAARELLNMRLEEKLLGEDSRLGRLKAMKERRSRRRQKQIDRLLVKSNAVELQRSTQHDYLSFLKGLKPLPPEVVMQIDATCETFSGRKIFISTLFGAECNNWWPILQQAFARANISFNQNGTAVASQETNYVSLPLLFEYLFPLATVPSNEESYHPEDLQLERCRHDVEALANVQRAFRCFCELFGLRLKEQPSTDGLLGLALVTDGANWLELKSRMADPLDGRPTAFARVGWPRVYFSLRTLELASEANSVNTFFRREVRKHGSNWGKEILKAISRGV